MRNNQGLKHSSQWFKLKLVDIFQLHIFILISFGHRKTGLSTLFFFQIYYLPFVRQQKFVVYLF